METPFDLSTPNRWTSAGALALALFLGACSLGAGSGENASSSEESARGVAAESDQISESSESSEAESENGPDLDGGTAGEGDGGTTAELALARTEPPEGFDLPPGSTILEIDYNSGGTAEVVLTGADIATFQSWVVRGAIPGNIDEAQQAFESEASIFERTFELTGTEVNDQGRTEVTYDAGIDGGTILEFDIFDFVITGSSDGDQSTFKAGFKRRVEEAGPEVVFNDDDDAGFEQPDIARYFPGDGTAAIAEVRVSADRQRLARGLNVNGQPKTIHEREYSRVYPAARAEEIRAFVDALSEEGFDSFEPDFPTTEEVISTRRDGAFTTVVSMDEVGLVDPEAVLVSVTLAETIPDGDGAVGAPG